MQVSVLQLIESSKYKRFLKFELTRIYASGVNSFKIKLLTHSTHFVTYVSFFLHELIYIWTVFPTPFSCMHFIYRSSKSSNCSQVYIYFNKLIRSWTDIRTTPKQFAKNLHVAKKQIFYMAIETEFIVLRVAV